MTTTPPAATAAPKPARSRPKPVVAATITEVPKARNWSWQHGPIAGPWNAGTGVIAAGMVGDLAAVSPWWGAAAGGVGAAALTARSIARNVSPLGVAYRAACMVGGGSWLWWALDASAWNVDVLTAAVVGVVGAGLAAPEMSDHEARVTGRRMKAESDAAAAQVKAANAAERMEMALEWVARIELVAGVKGVIVRGIQEWPGRTGYTMEMRLPGGMTYERLGKHADALATEADLPHGCGVEVEPGPSRGICHVKVSIVDTTAEPVPYPTDYSPLSFMGPLPIGMHRAAVPATVEIAEDPVVLCGRQGSGKTVTLQVITLDVARCDDAVIWQIDLNGAGISRPWVTPWLEGRAARPVVDWVAATPEEALLMARTLIAICTGRKGAYAKLMRSVNDDKLPVSREVPAIVLVTDEGAEAVAANRGNRELSVALETVVSIGRAARGRLIISGVRATADIIPVPIQAQAGVKIWMRPEDQHETAQLLGWSAGASVNDAPHPGSGLMRKPGVGGIRPYRGHILKPQQIEDAAIQLAGRRPELDKASAAIGGRVYAERWDRYRAWATDQPGGETIVSSTNPTPPSNPTPPTPPGSGVSGLAGAAGNLGDALAELREVRERAERKSQGPAEPDFDDAFAQIVAGYRTDPTPAEPVSADAFSSGQAVSGMTRMTEFLTEAGEEGIHYEKLHEKLRAAGVNISQATLFRWLKSAVGVEGKPGFYRAAPPTA